MLLPVVYVQYVRAALRDKGTDSLSKVRERVFALRGDFIMRSRISALATPHSSVTTRRSFISSITATSLALAAGFAARSASADGGQVGYITVQGAELFVHPSNLSAILYMDEGTPVDVLFGPYEGLYQIRYYGTDGWVWADYLSLNGYAAPAGDVGGGGEEAPVYDGAAVYADEHWIDVDRSNGLVRLMVGDQEVNSFWASLGFDSSDYGFYATAIGTYYVYGFQQSLHYTAFADAYISDWVAFDPERYNGFHSYSKDADGNILPNGGGRTGGCVALAPGDIDQLFDFAQMDMRIEIHW